MRQREGHHLGLKACWLGARRRCRRSASPRLCHLWSTHRDNPQRLPGAAGEGSFSARPSSACKRDLELENPAAGKLRAEIEGEYLAVREGNNSDRVERCSSVT